MALLDNELSFDRGKLFAIEPTRVVAIRAWPEPGMWTGEDERSCKLPVHLKLGLADIDFKAKGGDPIAAHACNHLLATLPKEFGEDMLRFPEHSWHLLKLIWQVSEALELIRSNPALGFAVACRVELKTRVDDGKWPDVRELVFKKREEIAAWLELPPTRSACAIFGRVTHEVTHLRGVRALRALLTENNPTVRKLLLHARHINADVLAMLTNAALVPHVTATLLEEVSFIRSAEGHVAERLDDAFRRWPHAVPNTAFPVVRTLSELDRLIMRVEGEEHVRHIAKRAVIGAFPPPPVRGNENIQPLTNVDALINEGIEQKNCAGDYGRRVVQGAVYLYRVLAPERCTLSLVKDGNAWRMDQLRTKCNAMPKSPATLLAVNAWLRGSP